jgi:hypothetical protein
MIAESKIYSYSGIFYYAQQLKYRPHVYKLLVRCGYNVLNIMRSAICIMTLFCFEDRAM